MALSTQDLARQVLANIYVLGVGTNAPPGAPAVGDRYVVGSAPTGAWVGLADAIVLWDGAAWIPSAPGANDGWGVFNYSTNSYYGWTGAAWVALTVAGLPVWNPDLPPATPHALDDEFTDAALAAKWDTGNPGANFAAALDTTAQMLRTTSAGNGGSRYGWVTQDISAYTEGAIYTKLALMSQNSGSFTEAALMLTEAAALSTGTPTTARFYTCSHYISNTDVAAEAGRWTNYTTQNSVFSSISQGFGPYLRFRWNGVAVERDVSSNGIEWFRMGTSQNMVFTPTRAGLAHNCTLNAFTSIARFAFFRAFTGAGTSGFDATRIGRISFLPAV